MVFGFEGLGFRGKGSAFIDLGCKVYIGLRGGIRI
jgi:hypothetical protein